MTTRRLPVSLLLVAILQFIPPLLLPPAFYGSIRLPVWIVIVALFALLGVNLLRLRDWARVATVFVQGFNIIVRLLTLVSNAVPARTGDVNLVLIAVSITSMILSAFILYTVDQPDVQLLMQQ
jgi:hypothetical protein